MPKHELYKGCHEIINQAQEQAHDHMIAAPSFLSFLTGTAMPLPSQPAASPAVPVAPSMMQTQPATVTPAKGVRGALSSANLSPPVPPVQGMFCHGDIHTLSLMPQVPHAHPLSRSLTAHHPQPPPRRPRLQAWSMLPGRSLLPMARPALNGAFACQGRICHQGHRTGCVL